MWFARELKYSAPHQREKDQKTQSRKFLSDMAHSHPRSWCPQWATQSNVSQQSSRITLTPWVVIIHDQCLPWTLQSNTQRFCRHRLPIPHYRLAVGSLRKYHIVSKHSLGSGAKNAWPPTLSPWAGILTFPCLSLSVSKMRRIIAVAAELGGRLLHR